MTRVIRRGVNASVWTFRNLAWCAAMCAGLSVTSGRAQPQDGRTSDSGAQRGVELRGVTPDPARMMHAATSVQAWLREGGTSPVPAAGLPIDGAAITLRRDGVVVGRGAVLTLEPGAKSDPLRDALGQAWSQMLARTPSPNDALRDQRAAELGSQLSVSMEYAWGVTPIEADTPRGLDESVKPGVHGIAVRSGESWAAVFPEEMLLESMPASAAINIAAARLSADKTLAVVPLADLKTKHGLTFYRFETLHLVQTTPGEPSSFRRRGQKVVPLSEIDGRELVRMGAELREYLSRQIEGNGSIGGAYDPVRGKELTASTGLGGRSIAALALARAWGCASLDRGTREAAAQDHAKVCAGLPKNPESLADAAMVVVAVDAVPGLPRPAGLKPARRLLLENPALPLEVERLAALPEAGLIAWACVIAAGEDAALLDRARAVVRAVYRVTPPANLVAHLPFLAWAELELAEARAGGASERRLASAVALRDARDLIVQHQLREGALDPEDADYAGGIGFPGGVEPWPTWQSVRPIAFLATSLRAPGVTSEGERIATLNATLGGMRFLRQLMAGESQAWMYFDAKSSAGGVRSSMIDQRQPVEASAGALLSVCEALDALRALSQPRSPAPPPAEKP